VVRRVGEYSRDQARAGESRHEGHPEGPDQDPLRSVHALGRIEPAGGLYPVGAPAGLRIGRILVEVGQEVREGEELAYVEGYSERKAQVGLIEAQLAEAREQERIEEDFEKILDQEANIERDSIARLEEPEIRTQEANIDVLQEKAKGSRKDYDHLVELNRDRRGNISAQELERQHLVMRQDEATLRGARAELEKYKAGRATRMAKLDVQLRKSKAASLRARRAIPARSLEKQLELAREQVNQGIIRAPRTGRILAILAKPGEVPGPKPLLQLGDTRRMYVVAEVDEDQIPLIRKHQKATIENHAWRRPFTGTVESWALMVAKNDVLGLDPAAAAYARVVEIKIKVDEPCDELRDRTHMQVNVDIALNAPDGPRPARKAP
jgi:HlyD family secretion protein